jgi:hypothetical protein
LILELPSYFIQFFLDEFDRAFEEQFPKTPHARYDYEIYVPLGIGKRKEFHVPKWEELLNGLGLVGKVMCLVPTQLLVLGLSYLWTIMALFRLLKPVLWNSCF